MKHFRVAAIGSASWDRLLVTDRYPEPGTFAKVLRSVDQAGGTTTNTATALARLGIAVTVAAMVGDDDLGHSLRRQLAADGCDVRFVTTRAGEPTDTSTVVVSGVGEHVERTILWQRGARLRHGDHIPIAELIAHDLVILDLDDPRLQRLIVDLPIHVAPRTRLLGTLTYLTELPRAEALQLALSNDYLTGAAWQYGALTGASDLPGAIERMRQHIAAPQTVTRLAAISRGPDGCVLIDERETVYVPSFPVDVVDPTGAGDAFAAGLALGILERRPLSEIGRLANALGALSIRGLGARATLPSMDEVNRLLQTHPPRERHA